MDTCFEPTGAENMIGNCTTPADTGTPEQRLRCENRRLRRLLELQDRDRQLIGYEIHDGLAQELSAALMQFQAFQSIHNESSQLDWNAFLLGVEQLCTGIQETRQLVAGLRPIGDKDDLPKALRELVQRTFAGGGMKIELDLKGDCSCLPAPLKNAIFRIVQEGVANMRRHSQSDRLRVVLRHANGKVRLSVQDWGVGFAPDKVGEGHYGLEGIRRRAELFGGHAGISSALGAGTRIDVEMLA